MDLNRFLPCESVLPHHGVLLAPDYAAPGQYVTIKVVYSGPLRDLNEDLLEQAKITLVHPGTFAALKARLEEMGVGEPIEEAMPPAEGCVTGGGLTGEHDWLPRTFIGDAKPHAYLCRYCGKTWEPPLTDNQR